MEQFFEVSPFLSKFKTHLENNTLETKHIAGWLDCTVRHVQKWAINNGVKYIEKGGRKYYIWNERKIRGFADYYNRNYKKHLNPKKTFYSLNHPYIFEVLNSKLNLEKEIQRRKEEIMFKARQRYKAKRIEARRKIEEIQEEMQLAKEYYEEMQLAIKQNQGFIPIKYADAGWKMKYWTKRLWVKHIWDGARYSKAKIEPHFRSAIYIALRKLFWEYGTWLTEERLIQEIKNEHPKLINYFQAFIDEPESNSSVADWRLQLPKIFSDKVEPKTFSYEFQKALDVIKGTLDTTGLDDNKVDVVIKGIFTTLKEKYPDATNGDFILTFSNSEKLAKMQDRVNQNAKATIPD